MNKSGRKMAKRVLGYIEAFPEKHDQISFIGKSAEVVHSHSVCNSTMCVAGTAVYLEEGVDGIINTLADENEELFEVKGARILGLTDKEADALFYTYDNKVAKKMLKAVVKGDKDRFWTLHNAYNSF